MSIELNRRVKTLEQQLAEVNRQIAALQKPAECVQGCAEVMELVKQVEKRPVGRPRKNG
jgi:prefoldin subunit 5